ncbi:hypothetical protein SSX86_021196 [Deinandra increscens subsp. villosa]|uniref:D-isomer specific 2-hydroxyacid dehydrogenase catalytic domain-containing protein n=1 Tax=Deinandra increscens subsp. villosa TaxID=3103831 RepID=A0AAP0GTY9_9ASTR
METIDVLLTTPTNDYLQQQLKSKFNLLRLWDFPHKDEFFKEHSGSIRAVVTNPMFGTDREFFDSVPNVEIVSTFSVGVNHVDLGWCKERGIRVSNTPDVLTDDVADTAIGLILTTLRGICESDRFVRGGLWKKGGEFKVTTKVRFLYRLEFGNQLSVLSDMILIR